MGERLSKERLVELYHEQDLTQGEIAEKAGVSQWTISKWMREAGVDTSKPRDEDLKADLQRVADELGESPSYDQYREHGEYGANTVKRRFDGWNAAKEAAGIETRAPDRKVSQEELLADLERVAEKLGKSPTQRELNEHGEYTHNLYYERFDGGLSEAKERAGLVPNQAGERVSVECVNCGDDLERYNSDIKHKEKVFCDRACLGEHRSEEYSGDGNPRSTLQKVDCEACGDSVLRAKWQRKRYSHFYCDDCWGNATVQKECEECEALFEVPPALDHQRFCSYQCAGDWRSENITGDAHPRFKEDEFPRYYGPNWRKQRRRARMRDDHTCQHCGLTREESLDEHGEVLSVHHKTAIREFVQDGELDYEQANRLENLVTLCRSCHSITEGNQHSNA